MSDPVKETIKFYTEILKLLFALDVVLFSGTLSLISRVPKNGIELYLLTGGIFGSFFVLLFIYLIYEMITGWIEEANNG